MSVELYPAGLDRDNSDWFLADTDGQYYHGYDFKNGVDQINNAFGEDGFDKEDLWDNASEYQEFAHAIVVFEFSWQIFKPGRKSWAGFKEYAESVGG